MVDNIFFFACGGVLLLHGICAFFAPKNSGDHIHGGNCCSGYKDNN